MVTHRAPILARDGPVRSGTLRLCRYPVLIPNPSHRVLCGPIPHGGPPARGAWGGSFHFYASQIPSLVTSITHNPIGRPGGRVLRGRGYPTPLIVVLEPLGFRRWGSYPHNSLLMPAFSLPEPPGETRVIPLPGYTGTFRYQGSRRAMGKTPFWGATASPRDPSTSSVLSLDTH